MPSFAEIRVIDSHTEGEPTRVIVGGAPELSGFTLAGKAADLGRNHVGFCRGVALEPRGHSAIVAALLLPPSTPGVIADVIFFNNAGLLGMCGHGTIGVAETLRELRGLSPGDYRIGTRVGEVVFRLEVDGRVSVTNVRSYRLAKSVQLDLEEIGQLSGDIAYGGNWFFLASSPGIEVHPANLSQLTAAACAIRETLTKTGITGEAGAAIDHIELFSPDGHRNFVLCPGLEYDRSPCGTGTSAKLACLAADGKLAPGEEWIQESVIGSRFTAKYQKAEAGGVIPTITGSAFITGESTLRFDPRDPFREGIRF